MNDAQHAAGAGAADPDALVRAGMQQHAAKDVEGAERLYRQALAMAPDHPDALHWLGVLLHRSERGEEGRALIERSIALAPAFPGFYNNYGNLLLEGGDLADAERAYRRCLDLDPTQSSVWCNLGICLRKAGRPGEAVHAFEEALSADSGSPESFKSLVDILEAQGKFNEVVAAYEESFATSPRYEPAFAQLSRLYYITGRIEDAARTYRRWVDMNPENSVARHMLAACTGEGVPPRADGDMVRKLFDSFAASFDEVLGKLGYQTPQRLCEQVAGHVDTASGRLRVLDLGCGTGLCGPLLRPWASELLGVDLSPRMLDKARQRGIYDALIEGELVAYLRERPTTFDLIVCADTLCYFGALGDALAAAQAALKPGGRFAFSIERADDPADGDFKLHPHGRYAHRPAYVEAALDTARLSVLDRRDMTLRRELGKPVEGCLFCTGA
jgi:predicted TPR repeat methyltransferase